MMQNLFGDQSEEEEEVDSEHESNPHPNYASDEVEGAPEPEGDGEVEGQGEVEVESDGELRDVEPDPGESEGEREQSSQEVGIGDQREESEVKDSDSEKEEYGQRVVTSRRRDAIESGSERSEDNHYADNEDEEVDQARSPSKSPSEKDQTHHAHPAAEIRDVFGDSDDEEMAEYAVPNDMDQDENRSPMEEEDAYEKNLRPEDMVPDEDVQYDSEDEHVEVKHKEKPVGPPLELQIPLRPPPADPSKMNLIKVSNIMGIERKPFDPKTFVEEDMFVTDESGSKKRIRLENNIVRYRSVRNAHDKFSYESNARFVRWSDGSLQLLIGNEVLDISVQDAQHDQAHIFLKHGKGILQSQGRLLRKMKFMPSSLSSNSHRLLTALVDSRHKKVYKVKNCITDIDPEREKEEKEKAESQTIRANVLLNRKREKVSKKYNPQTTSRSRQLSTGYLEEALDEDDEMEYNDSRRPRHRFDEDLEEEARAEKRILNAKKTQGYRDIPRKSSAPAAKSSRRPVEFSDSEREESEYESDGDEDERSPPRKRIEDEEPEYQEDEDEEQEEEADTHEVSEEEKPNKQKVKESGGRNKRKPIESDEDSPPRKAPTHRRLAVYDSDED